MTKGARASALFYYLGEGNGVRAVRADESDAQIGRPDRTGRQRDQQQEGAHKLLHGMAGVATMFRYETRP